MGEIKALEKKLKTLRTSKKVKVPENLRNEIIFLITSSQLTVDEASKAFELHRSTILRWISSDKKSIKEKRSIPPKINFVELPVTPTPHQHFNFSPKISLEIDLGQGRVLRIFQ